MDEPDILPEATSVSPAVNGPSNEENVNIVNNEESSLVVPMDVTKDEEYNAVAPVDSNKDEELNAVVSEDLNKDEESQEMDVTENEDSRTVIVEDVKNKSDTVIVEDVKNISDTVIVEDVKNKSDTVIVEDVKNISDSVVVEDVKNKSDTVVVEDVKNKSDTVVVEDVKNKSDTVAVEDVKNKSDTVVEDVKDKDADTVIVEDLENKDADTVVVDNVKNRDADTVVVEDLENKDADTVVVDNVKNKEADIVVLEDVKNEETDSMMVEESKPIRLEIEGFNDENEDTTVKAVEEIQNYIATKAIEYLKDPEINPLLVLKKRTADLNEKMQKKSDDLLKIKKLYEVLHKDQKRFLTHIGIIPKPEMKTVGISIDLPWIPETVPNMGEAKAVDIISPGHSFTKQVGVTKQAVKKVNAGPIECIDLTDDPDPPPTTDKKIVAPGAAGSSSSSAAVVTKLGHPAPLPSPGNVRNDYSYQAIPVPRLKISAEDKGIILQWDIPPQMKNVKLQGFEIFGYQEKSNVPISCALWKRIGFVRIMPLPMSCSLTQFVEGFKYHFTIRTMDSDGKCGAFSDPASITFFPRKLS